MSDDTLDERGKRLAESIQRELGRRGFGETLTARYDAGVQAVLVGPVYLDAERQHEVYYPITLGWDAIVDDVIRRNEEQG